ncbi:asparaginase [Brevibacterium iodinum ATCC 49514]|uniref:Asparaginase n=1 Tax=Brevibacterium iodinum ATCC 49514 TaxID=1255616 RepID=A0A2H1JEF7_9MICO|nr:asparaginase [Brevibacterium iodinum]SMX85829.1 asparaginase [Brevibacterium iodinum ATCC 49514]SUW11218.1 L-asparaginase II [Brevibacterium iodinum]
MTFSTFTPVQAAELAVVERSGFIESRHIGSAVVLDPDGSPLISLGAPDAAVFTRSSLKPLQAIAAMSLGAQLTGPAAALAAASHKSEAGHVEVVESMLEAAGLSVPDLQCPSAHPADGAFRRELQELARTQGDENTDPRSPLYFNCSGKHAAFLAAARAIGADTSTYLSPDHPVQQKVAEVVADFASEEPSAVGIDGCGAPVFALSLTGLARAIGRVIRLGSSDDTEDDTEKEGAWAAYESEARTLTEAVFADPWTIEGHGRPNSTVIDKLGVFAKGGAEGVIVMATRSGYAVAVKCLDGSSRATGLVALTLLQWAGAFDVEPGAASASGKDTVDAVIAAITDPVTGGTDSEGRTNVVGRLELGEDIATIGERKRD